MTRPGPAPEPSDPWGTAQPAPGFAPVPPVDFGAAAAPAVPVPPAADPGVVVMQVGELAVTATVIHTPTGDIPLAGSTWQVAEYWHHDRRTPTWAVVVAVVGFCVAPFVSLLFLLVKETVPRGTVQVTVNQGARQYVSRVPVTDPAEVTRVHQQVNYVRSLAAL